MTQTIQDHLRRFPKARPSTLAQIEITRRKTEQLKAEIRTSKKTFVERLMENVADLRNLIGWQ